MKKKIGLLWVLTLCLSGKVLAQENVYVALQCEYNINVDINLEKSSETGWADVSVEGTSKRANYLGGRSNNMGGDQILFATKGLAVKIDYSASRDFFVTISDGRGEKRYACKVR